MRTQALLIRTWHQTSKSYNQVWRCSIENPANSDSVVGMAANEFDAIKDALDKLREDPDLVMPRNYAVNAVDSIRTSPNRRELEAIQYEYDDRR